MSNGELIRPAEVVISLGGEAGEEKAKAESKSILSKIVSGFESRMFRRQFRELESREQELGQNEEKLRKLAKELDLREKESKRMVEETVKLREAEGSRIQELEQSKEALNAELERFKMQLRTIHHTLSEMEVKEDKIAMESIALSKYNEEL